MPDKRIRQHGASRGYRIDHIARQFDARHDFADFNYIVVMYDETYHDICRKAHNEADRRKVIRMADYFTKYKGRTSVPDPYYGDGEDFEIALDLIEDGCRGMLDGLTNREHAGRGLIQALIMKTLLHYLPNSLRIS